MNLKQFIRCLKILENNFEAWDAPVIHMMKLNQESPYKLLITTILSLRAKDKQTAGIAQQLFTLADTPESMVNLDREKIINVIFAIGFHQKKSQLIQDISQDLLDRFDGKVPQTQKELLSIKGVGLKTANLVLASAFHQPYICVDIHVHRITNRWGFVETTSADKTEEALRKKIKEPEWIFKINYLLVAFGQTICQPRSPLCSQCPVRDLCPKIGVEHHR